MIVIAHLHLGEMDSHKGSFYHDGRFASLVDVVSHYDSLNSLYLTT